MIGQAGVSIAQVKQAVDAGQAVTRSQKFQVLAGSSLRDGTSTGDTLYFGSRESQTMLRVYDKRLQLEQRGREEAKDYGVRWELELKKDRAQACAKALLTLPPEDWREFLVGVLRSYVDFRETTRDAEPWEKYRAPLLSWWEALTEGFKRCRLVVEKVQQTLDEVCQWLGQSISAMLALAYLHRGESISPTVDLRRLEKIESAAPRDAATKARTSAPMSSVPSKEWKRHVSRLWSDEDVGADGATAALVLTCQALRVGIYVYTKHPVVGPGPLGQISL